MYLWESSLSWERHLFYCCVFLSSIYSLNPRQLAYWKEIVLLKFPINIEILAIKCWIYCYKFYIECVGGSFGKRHKSASVFVPFKQENRKASFKHVYTKSTFVSLDVKFSIEIFSFLCFIFVYDWLFIANSCYQYR